MTRIWRVAAAAAAALTLAGCTSVGATAGGGSGGPVDELKMGTFLDVTAWDPANADIGFDGPYLSAVYDPLVNLDEDSEPVPGLATDWTYSDDLRTLTMNLRSGVTFDDGEKFDAPAAVKNVEHLMAGTRSGQAYLNVAGVDAVDADTIRIHLNKRDDTLLYFMGLGRSWMASPAAIDAGTLDDGPVGSGPYTYDTSRSTPGSQYVFTKKPGHWDAATFPFPTVRMFPITDQTASFNAMLSGQLNVQYANPTNIAQAQQNGWTVTHGVATWVGLQFVDRTGQHLKPLGDVRVRRAISYAFDGAGVLKAVNGNIDDPAGTVTNQLFPAGRAVHDPALDNRYAHDLAKARQLMAEAGHPGGFPVTMPMSQTFQTWQPAVEQTLGQLGITVTWEDMSMPDYQKNAATYPMFIAVIAMDSNAMATVTDQITSQQWYNPEPSVDAFPEVRALVDQLGTATGDRQAALLEQLNATLVDLAWEDVWYQADNTFFSVPGITVTPVTGMMFPTLRFIQRG